MPPRAPSRKPRPRRVATPRTPVQDRSIERVERVLDAAEYLVEKHGMTNMTMTMIAKKSGVGRGTVYQFFPSQMAIWKGLALRYLAQLEAEFERKVSPQNFTRWIDAWDLLINVAIDFYNRNPVAQTILLGAEEGHDLRLADPEWDRRYAEWMRGKFIHLTEDPRMVDVKHLRVNVTAVTAIFALSVNEHGRITPFYAEQAKKMSIAYTARLREELLAGRRG